MMQYNRTAAAAAWDWVGGTRTLNALVSGNYTKIGLPRPILSEKSLTVINLAGVLFTVTKTRHQLASSRLLTSSC